MPNRYLRTIGPITLAVLTATLLTACLDGGDPPERDPSIFLLSGPGVWTPYTNEQVAYLLTFFDDPTIEIVSGRTPDGGCNKTSQTRSGGGQGYAVYDLQSNAMTCEFTVLSGFTNGTPCHPTLPSAYWHEDCEMRDGW